MQNLKKYAGFCALTSLFMVFLVVTSNILVGFSASSSFEPVFQKGMSYRPAPYTSYYYSTPESDESLRRMAEDNVKWVAIITWWFQENLTSTQIYPHHDFTPTNESLKHAIETAHDLGMKVMLKPMIDTEDARNEPRWMIPASADWFESYTAFITRQAQLANETGSEQLCVGCEFKYTESSAAGWRQIVAEVKKYYSGRLTYAATTDSYRDITWWDTLDYVGIDAFFDLTNKNDPTLEELTQAWNRTANDIEDWQQSIKKPILFTEIGYRSGDGNNKQPWNWTETLQPDLQEQFDCYLAAFKILWGKPWFQGFYWWIWESNPNAGGSDDTDFTPQNKPVEYLIRSWYSMEWRVDPFYELKQTYTSLLANYSSLNEAFNVLQGEYKSLLEQYNSLNNLYQDLLRNYTDLHKTYSDLQGLYEIQRNFLYAFILATILSSGTAILFLRKYKKVLAKGKQT